MNRAALAAGLLKYGEEWWGPNDTDHMVANLTDGRELDRDSIAHEMWTMGAWLRHKGCRNKPERGVADADYENTCVACETHLRAVADSILLSVRIADALAIWAVTDQRVRDRDATGVPMDSGEVTKLPLADCADRMRDALVGDDTLGSQADEPRDSK